MGVFPTFAAYAATFGKVYNGDEAATREAIYNQAVVEMEAHNADSTQTYTQGVNQFTDLTLEEFQALPIRGLLAGEKSGLPKVGVHEYNGETLATTVNWVTKQNSGCNGGLMDYAFSFYRTTSIASESSYPYTARDGSCKSSYTAAIPQGGVTGYKDVSSS